MFHQHLHKMSNSFILSALSNGVRTIQLNHPQNTITYSMYLDIQNILNKDAKNDSIVVTILTGVGDCFSNGHHFTTSNKTENEIKNEIKCIENFISAFIDYSKILIAVINGPAFGIGTTILGLCDIVYCSDRATFAAPFLQLGLCPEGTSSYVFPRILGRSKAMEIFLLGETMSAQEALRRGLVAKVISHECLSEFVKGLHKFGKLPVATVKSAKELLVAPIKSVLHAANKRELEKIEEMCTLPEYLEAKVRLLAKRSKL